MFRWAVELINALLDDVAPLANGNLSSSASLLARHGAEKRALTFAEKQKVVHAQLAAYVSAKRSQVAP